MIYRYEKFYEGAVFLLVFFLFFYFLVSKVKIGIVFWKLSLLSGYISVVCFFLFGAV